MKIQKLVPAVALVFCFARPALCLVDINTASLAELQTLPGIGPVLSQRIVEGRPYESLDDLARVKGMGPKTLNKFRDKIIAGEPSPGEVPVPPKAEKGGTSGTQEPQEQSGVPVYSVESFRLLHCYRCKNKFKVSSELKAGWCPYCGTRLAIW